MKIEFKSKGVLDHLLVLFDQDKKPLVSAQWQAANRETNQLVTKFLAQPEIKGDSQGLHDLFTPQGTRLLLAGLGKDQDKNQFRNLGAKVGKRLLKLAVPHLWLLFPDQAESLEEGLEAFGEGLLLGHYEYKEFKQEKPEEGPAKVRCEALFLRAKGTPALKKALEKAQIMADSTNLARDIGNKPGNHFTPTHFKEACEKVAKEAKLKFTALSEAQMKKLGMGCLLGVSAGSEQPAFLNILEYSSGKKKAPTLLLVGKGLTFDAGGISLKPAAKMDEMKHDMCGGAAVLAAMRILGLLGAPLNVVGLIPSSENLPDGKATKPGDVLTAYNKTTVEVLNTDAEGRLILADALSYGVERFKPVAVVDVATLTGACLVALGSYHSGLISNDEALTNQVKQAAQATGDPVWQLPTGAPYKKQLEGTISDLKNIGGPEAGTITAGIFLEQFVDKTPWVHLDIAGTAWNAPEIEYYPDKGATGTAARLLAQLALDWK